jgi:hypothetical protein
MLPWPTAALQVTGFVIGAVSTVSVARSAARHRLTSRRLLIATGGLVAAMFAATSWLAGPMHDIALSWGSHGRWGDLLVDDRGGQVYVVTSQTLPALIFVPLIALVTWRGAIVLRRARLDNPALNPKGLRPAG